MTLHLHAICLAADRPARLARFWGGLLDRRPAGGDTLPPSGDGGPRIRFLPAAGPKTGPNRAHFDLTSTSPEDQRRTVDAALRLGARHTDVGQRPEEGHVVLADPEGNEFCVIEAGNRFLAGCGPVGALACDGTREVGLFWSAALGWPLVWDQDGETAVQAPQGGTKITWGGPPVSPRTEPDRVTFDLAVDAGGDLAAEVARLVALGATRGEPGGPFHVELSDPDGTPFRVSGAPAPVRDAG